jgi:5-methylcytosine-specific restriction protein B
MEIKARGVVKDNPGDGRHLAIEWETDFEPKIIYFYTYRSTIDPIDKSKYKDTTIAWVFGDIEQDITWLEEQAALANGSFVLGHSEDTNLNRILFGPPGTGKTYRSVEEALSILDPACLQANSDNRTALKSRFDELVSTGDICFVTFHQSFSYEDFVEGLRAVTNPDGSLAYKVENGVFKTICDSAGALSLENCSELPDGLEDGLANSTQKDGLRLGDAIGNSYKIGKVSSDLVLVEKKGGSSVPFTWDFLNELTELVRSKAISLGDIEKGQVFDKLPNVKLEKYLLNGYSNIVHDLVEKLVNSRSNVDFSPNIFSPIESPKVLIIDEINRGNVSRIFGELITLIEVSKRRGNAEALEVILPYSKMRFSVPRNVYLIGTMNTADRSLMGLDIALRRRFSFIELPPKPDMLDSVVVENINIGTLLRLINERIEVLLDRDHCLGHTYFLPLKEMENPSLKDLATVFRQHILPLLQEYFFEDWERIHFVLNDHRKASPEHCFISRPTNKVAELFGDKEGDRFLDNRWVINEAAFDLPESYLGVIGVHE